MTDGPAWEEIEHTADWALCVWGADLRALLENAARGMISLIGGEADVQRRPVTRTIHVEGADPEVLLINWLTELLYLIEDEGIVFTQIAVRSATQTSLDAKVKGIPGGMFSKYIKAATYHNLQIRCDDGGCETVIVFDV